MTSETVGSASAKELQLAENVRIFIDNSSD